MTAEPPNIEPDAQVALWLTEGHSEKQIAQAAAELFPAKYNVRKAIDKARADFIELAKVNPAEMAGRAIAATQLCYAKMLKIGDYQGALRAAKQLADMTERPTMIDE